VFSFASVKLVLDVRKVERDHVEVISEMLWVVQPSFTKAGDIP
jgi:hypothetical protein